jgi:hypothetical protein
MINEYRMTRRFPYKDCSDPRDLERRQGYYIRARSETEAILLFDKFLHDKDIVTHGDMEHGYDCQLWKRGIAPHDVTSGVSQS